MEKRNAGYNCWLQYEQIEDNQKKTGYRTWCDGIVVTEDTMIIRKAVIELQNGLKGMVGCKPKLYSTLQASHSIVIGTIDACKLLADSVTEEERLEAGHEGYIIKTLSSPSYRFLIIAGGSEIGVLYGVFDLLSRIRMNMPLEGIRLVEKPAAALRMLDHWDNFDGSVERGYAGRSLFFTNNRFHPDKKRIRDYARLIASIGINSVVINNVNVRDHAFKLISGELLSGLSKLAGLFREYGIRIYTSINFASPMRIGNLPSADPLDPAVRAWWAEKAKEIYSIIPDFGGFLVKADSEFNPGPYAYGRTHADGANMLADALKPFGGIVVWRCFVYNCLQDWRDSATDRAKAAYDNFKPLDGTFSENVVLQIKNGPMDFQVREPVSPLLGGMKRTNECMELQITQEYTGQQVHVCFLVPQWKEVLSFDTYARGEGSTIAEEIQGNISDRGICGIAGVANIGDDPVWTGHPLAQANLYGFGRLAWNPNLSAESIAEEWVRRTFGNRKRVVGTIVSLLLESWKTYELYTSPLGIGWMVNPSHHYGPSPDGYEYSPWGTYHKADTKGIGVDRTSVTGTGYTAQYFPRNTEMYDSIRTCPEELLLFFHHVPYSHKLSTQKTVLQHIYDSHFEGAEKAAGFVDSWESLHEYIKDERFTLVKKRLETQAEHAREWCDVINSYFYRKTGIGDQKGRKLY